MKFEELYQKYIDGTATEEEKAFVEEEIAKAKKLSAIIDSQDAKRVVAPVEKDDVKKAKKQYTLRSIVMIVAVSFIALVVAAGAVCGGVFGTAVTSAKNLSHFETTNEAGECAKRYVVNNLNDNGSLIVTEIDRSLVTREGLNKAYYTYEVEVQSLNGKEYDIVVDGRNGECKVIEID